MRSQGLPVGGNFGILRIGCDPACDANHQETPKVGLYGRNFGAQFLVLERVGLRFGTKHSSGCENGHCSAERDSATGECVVGPQRGLISVPSERALMVWLVRKPAHPGYNADMERQMPI